MKFLIFNLLLILLVGCNIKTGNRYSTPEKSWLEKYGNHRAVLKVNEQADAVFLDILWRRHDRMPDKKQFLIIHKESGDTIQNIYRVEVDNERCRLAFGPVDKTGTFYFYYLPYVVQEGWGFYNKGYLRKEKEPDAQWVKNNNLEDEKKLSELPKAELVEFQSRTPFDSFYPMEVIALASEKDSLIKQYDNDDFLIFPEVREFPIRMLDDIPQRWIEKGPSSVFKGEASKNEYYTFQLGIFSSVKIIKDLKVHFSALSNGENEIPPGKITCFNTGGIDSFGKPFTKRVDVNKGNVQPLWIGVDIPEDIQAGTYRGSVSLTAENAKTRIVDVSIKIDNNVLADRGDSELWRHSRLRWLNSTLGIDDEPTKPYSPINVLDDKSFELTGKEVRLSASGMPAELSVNKREILQSSISLIIETKGGTNKFPQVNDFKILKDKPGVQCRKWQSVSSGLQLDGTVTIESDGYIKYKVKLKALRNVEIKDVRLEIPFKENIAKYMMGMGLPGTTVPEIDDAKWKGPHDSFWIGNAHAGLWCELRGSSYSGPLLNLYKPEYPNSWYNENKGGFKLLHTQNRVKAVVYSGKRELNQGGEIEFEWSMLITPVKDINYRSQFVDRYYHNGRKPMPSDEDIATGVKIVNLHHANNYNPHINYPFIAVDSMKWFVNELHKKDVKVKIYYTIRELTNYTSELWALRSLGFEILGDGRGKGYPWLREHLVYGYRPQWYQHFSDKSPDASIVNAKRDSRWYNYYIEGLAWLIKNVDIDGLYLDDVSYDRRTVKRIRKVLDNEKPGCLLDLHSNTGFSKGPATQYAEYFPYLDKLWFGESFNYNKMSPSNWFVEVSGIPFGLMGDMLHGGGNRWLGMLFGMTVRFPWETEGVKCDPRPVWKIWDEFGIQDSQMIGFWENNPVIETGNNVVKATAYMKADKVLISLGNFSDEKQTVKLKVNWKKIGFTKDESVVRTPEVKDFQSASRWQIDDEITIEPRKGILFFIEKK